MAAPKGHPGWGGRPKGTPNKVTASIRETFSNVFNALQNDEKANLTSWGKDNTTEFYKLASKLIPLDVAVQGGLTLQVITGVPDYADEPEDDAPDGTDLV